MRSVDRYILFLLSHRFSTRRVIVWLNSTAAIHPKALKRKSSQSPTRVGANNCWPISMRPLKIIGAIMAHGISRFASTRSWLLKYSNHNTEQSPKYIIKCTALSILATSLNGVFGGLKNERNKITPMINIDKGYFFR